MENSVGSPSTRPFDEADHQEEIKLLIEAAKNDRGAVAELYRIHYYAVSTYVHRRISNEEDANDVVSEVFIAMVVGLPKFRWRGVPFCIWLYRIATHKISRWARRRRWLVLDQFDELQTGVSNRPDQIDSEFIALALESLPVKLQDALSLHYLEGLSVAEIASVLNRSEGTVKSRLHTGRNLLRKLLEKRGMNFEQIGSTDESL